MTLIERLVVQPGVIPSLGRVLRILTFSHLIMLTFFWILIWIVVIPKLFCFFEVWSLDPPCREVIDKAWEMVIVV